MIFIAVLSLIKLPYDNMELIDYFIFIGAALCIISFVVLVIIKIIKRRGNNRTEKNQA